MGINHSNSLDLTGSSTVKISDFDFTNSKEDTILTLISYNNPINKVIHNGNVIIYAKENKVFRISSFEPQQINKLVTSSTILYDNFNFDGSELIIEDAHFTENEGYIGKLNTTYSSVIQVTNSLSKLTIDKLYIKAQITLKGNIIVNNVMEEYGM